MKKLKNFIPKKEKEIFTWDKKIIFLSSQRNYFTNLQKDKKNRYIQKNSLQLSLIN